MRLAKSVAVKSLLRGQWRLFCDKKEPSLFDRLAKPPDVRGRVKEEELALKEDLASPLEPQVVQAVEAVAAEVHKDEADKKKKMEYDLFGMLLKQKHDTREAASKAVESTAWSSILSSFQAEKEAVVAAVEDKPVKTTVSKMTNKKLQSQKAAEQWRRGKSGVQSGADEALAVRAKVADLPTLPDGLLKGARRPLQAMAATQESASEMEPQPVSPAVAADSAGSDAPLPGLFVGAGSGIFDQMLGEPSASLQTSDGATLWQQLDAEQTARQRNAGGPRNALDEMVRWTEQGRLWPYPIDNDYMRGDEAQVGFDEHVFLERHLDGLDFPKTGPVRDFMQLVCQGLSKNPYMNVEKKRRHIRWFKHYFDASKLDQIERWHQQEKA